MFELAKILVYFFLYSSVSGSYDYLKKSDRTSRYSKFDKVMNRIDKMNDESDSPFDVHPLRFRHKGRVWPWRTTTTTTTTTTEASLFETYGDLEGDEEYDDLLEDEDDFDYEDDDEDSETEDPFFDSIDEELQAEEPSIRTTTLAPKPVSSLTAFKWSHFGTRERVEESRRQQMAASSRQSPEQSKVNAFLEHYVRVKQQTKCLRPLPRVIPIQREHPDPTKSYTPQCTILHRCAEDSGCCNRNTKCQYKTRVLVPLYFYENTVGTQYTRVVKLDFYNHTECECKEKSEYDLLDPGINGGITYKSSETLYNTPEPENLKRCKCPKPFQPTSNSYECTCDCEEGNQDCIQLKKGKEHFSMNNRMCIQNGECETPHCEYGSYMSLMGKCPSKMDKLEEYRRINLHF
ncbi:uncharacterized protein [Leptinotarsa decemlineata]|uniref:uncharacterized protein n=1 Tax=Leptinotarsa decemlineata TaxID=7539 RepID=UPI003D306D65